MDYTIVAIDNAEKLIAQVKSLMADGWCPVGGITNFWAIPSDAKPDDSRHDRLWLAQAMIKPKS